MRVEGGSYIRVEHFLLPTPPPHVLPEAKSYLAGSNAGAEERSGAGAPAVGCLSAKGSEGHKQRVEGCLSLWGEGKGHEKERAKETEKLWLQVKPGSLDYSRKEMLRGTPLPETSSPQTARP